MDYCEEERAIVYLNSCTKFDYREKVALLRAAGDPARLFADSFKPNGVKLPDPEERRKEADKLFRELEKKNYFAVTLVSSDYPEPLKATDEPPLVLFGAGRRELLKKRKFCIVGSRVTPSWAEGVAKRISEELCERFVIVTGLAEGGDRAAIDGALSSGNLISVLPCGLNECYPSSHFSLKEKIKENGLLLSEYSLNEKARAYSFYARNRILAGLSEGVLVVSAGERSGTSITAGKALDYGRDVFALPYNVGAKQGEGCNALLKKGASLVTDSGDILSYYGFEKKKKEKVKLSSEEEKVYKVLQEAGELHTAVIAERTGLKVYEATAALSSLEMKNLAVKAGGNRYSAL